jgi:protein BUR2
MDTDAVVAESERQWLYTEEEILRAPSIVDGISVEEEHTLRAKGANFILQVGAMTKIPATSIGAACVLFNRFLMRYSLVQKAGGPRILHHYQIAAVVLFIATKVFEHSRKIKDIVIACCRVAQKNPVLIVDEQTKDFWRWRDTILYNEDLILDYLCFDLNLESPYTLLWHFMKKHNVANNKLLRETSWAFINDTNMTYMCLLFSSRTIAAAAIYCGATRAGISFPDDDQGRPWWEAEKVKGIDMRRAYNHMVTFIENQPLRSDHERAYVGSSTPLEVDERFAKTRLRREQAPDTPEPVDVTAWNQNSINAGNGDSGPPPPPPPPPPAAAPRSRVPRAAQLEERPVKKFKIDKDEPQANGESTKVIDSGSEEGEI